MHGKVNFFQMKEEEKKNKKGKKVLRKVPDDIVPRSDDNWILQPIVISMMRYDYDVIQSRAVVAVMKEMQSAIKEVIYHHAVPERQLSLFSNDDFLSKFGGKEIDTEKEIVLKLALKSFGCDKRKYDMLKNSLKQLVSIPVEIPVKSLDDEDYYKVANLCTAYIPKEPYSKYVYLKFSKDVAVRLISNEKGTHNFLDNVVFSAKSKYTQRMYLFISAWKNQGATCVRSVQWIRRWLRLEDSHKRWNMFYTRVLKVAEDELYAMAMDGLSDLYFTTKKIYDSGSEVGEPDKLQFVIHKAGQQEDTEEMRVMKTKLEDIRRFCHTRFGIRGTDLKAILEALTEENMDKMIIYLGELDKREQKALKSGKIDNLSRHAFTCIMNELKEWADIEKENMNALVRSDERRDIVVKEDSGRISLLSDVDKEKWRNVLDGLRKMIPADSFDVWFAEDVVYLDSVAGGVVCLHVPSASYVEVMESMFISQLSSVLRKEWGDDVEFVYKFY